MKRRDKTNYYLDIAETTAERSTCLRRQYGAVIVKNDEVISTGYNGAPRGAENCIDTGICYRKENNIPHGAMYEKCKSSHAESNAIISASRKEMIDADLYLCGIEYDTQEYVKDANCCTLCKRMVLNAGIKRVFVRDTEDKYRVINTEDWLKDDAYMN